MPQQAPGLPGTVAFSYSLFLALRTLPRRTGSLFTTSKESSMFRIFSPAGVSVLSAGALLSLVNGLLYAWSVFMLPLENATGLTRTQTSLVFTITLVFFGAGMMCGGFVIRRIGTRLTAALGGIMLSAGLLVSSCVTELWQLILAYGVAAGFGIGMANVVPTVTGVSWFPEKRGLVCGLMAFCLALGTLLLGSGAASTLIRLTGISRTMQLLGVLVLLLSLVASFFLVMPEHRTTKVAHRGVESLTTGQMLRTSRFRLVWLWDLSLQTGGLMIIGHIVPYAVESGCSPIQAGMAMGVYAVTNGFGRLLFGMLFDRKGFRFAMLANTCCMTTGLLGLAFLPGVAGFFGLLAGIMTTALAFGGTIPQFSAYIAQNFGPEHMESNVGMTATVFILAGFAGPCLGGCLHSLTGTYLPAVLSAAVMTIPGILAVMNIPGRA